MTASDRWSRFWHQPGGQDERGHNHGLPGLVAMIAVVAAGLTCAVVIVYVALTQRVTELEEYVAGRGVQRDAENQRLNDRIDRAVCELLEQLPAYDDLNAARAEYDCGPGLPVPRPEEFP